MSNASPLTLFLIRYPVIIFSIIMLVAGLLGLVFGRLSIGHIKLKGVVFRILCAILFLGAAGYFIPKYGLAVEIVLALVLVAIALLVAVLGIANALTVSIADRRRELAILRAVGGLRRQVRIAVWMEAAAVAVVGFVLGLGFSMVNIFYALAIFSGHALEFRFPALLAAALLPMLVAAALVAAITPAEAAVRAPLVSALEYE